MKITTLQQDILWSSPNENLQRADKAIDEAPLSDLYILPEMFSTGFCTEPEGIAERDYTSLRWMQQKAKQMGAAIAGSIATEEEGVFYIWGHSYEFDINNTWGEFEDFCKYVSGHDDIFYGTNKEILLEAEWKN